MNQAAEALPRQFIEELADAEVPVMAGVLQELKNILETPASSAAELAEVILNDAALTAKVLRLSNSVYYNPANHPINTVSRAVVQLGVAQIKSICVSSIVVDSFRTEKNASHLLTTVADSIHLAVQAKSFYEMSGHDAKESEEVLVAGLLRNLGALVFWSDQEHAHRFVDALDEDDDTSDEEIQRKILGCTFSEVTKELCGMWSLGNVLADSFDNALNQPRPVSEATIALNFGADVVASMKSSAPAEALETLTAKIAKQYNLDNDGALSVILNNTKNATRLAIDHGAKELTEIIKGAPPSSRPRAEVNKQLQDEVMKELSAASKNKVDVNTLFQTVLEGLHRAAGFERAAIALLDKSHSKVSAKYVVGSSEFPWDEKFEITLGQKDCVFRECVEKKRAAKASAGDISVEATGSQGAVMLAPILVGARLLGVYYVDCGDAPSVDNARQLGFNTLCAQANKSLSQLLARR